MKKRKKAQACESQSVSPGSDCVNEGAATCYGVQGTGEEDTVTAAEEVSPAAQPVCRRRYVARRIHAADQKDEEWRERASERGSMTNALSEGERD